MTYSKVAGCTAAFHAEGRVVKVCRRVGSVCGKVFLPTELLIQYTKALVLPHPDSYMSYSLNSLKGVI